MPGLFSWYNNQYASWNRMRRIQAPPFVARIDSRTSRSATAMHNGTDVNAATGNVGPNAASVGGVVINMGDLALNSPIPVNKDNKDTLFGPSIGVVSTAPEWCAVDAALDQKVFKDEKDLSLNEKYESDEEDELTPEIVKEWVKRSKEPSEPTTTLQALVNLKRPSIRLSPLAAPTSDPSSSSSDEHTDAHGKHHQQHGLEFEFDCDAPQCMISLHVIGVPASLGESDENHELPLSNGNSKESERLVLFETTLPGGFAKKLTLADGAVLELAKLEAAAKAHRAQLAASSASASGANTNAQGSAVNVSTGAGNTEGHDHFRKRFTFFRKRGRNTHTGSSTPNTQEQTAMPAPAVPTGPALAVVDAEAPNPNLTPQNQSTLAAFFAGGDAEAAKRKKEAEEEGVRVAIRLMARDSDGKPMKVRNEQVTYLHIVRQCSPASSASPAPGNGSAIIAPGSSSTGGDATATPNEEQANGQGVGKDEEKEKEDTRPWVVRVVKREARIGAHSFQLHEIYGLTAHASASDAAHHDSVTPSSPPPPGTEQTHTYPPTPGQPQVLSNDAGGETEDSPAECLLCLSAAREVVLLPCRHLVACRECAVNMVEFGAGGTVVQPAEAEPPANAGNNNAAENAAANAGDGDAPAPAPVAPHPTPATRRKRKAKGWFCPVCRQPYTSLLRITTAPPPSKGSPLGHHSNSDSNQADAKRASLTSSLDVDADSHSNSSPSQQHPTPVLATPAHPLATVAESGTTSMNEVGVNGTGNGTANGNGRETEGRGALASLTRPTGFLRHFSARARERDLERGN